MMSADFIAARKALGMSQSQLAETLGLHPMTISKYERGVDPIPRTVALAMLYLTAPEPAHGL